MRRPCAVAAACAASRAAPFAAACGQRGSINTMCHCIAARWFVRGAQWLEDGAAQAMAQPRLHEQVISHQSSVISHQSSVIIGRNLACTSSSASASPARVTTIGHVAAASSGSVPTPHTAETSGESLVVSRRAYP